MMHLATAARAIGAQHLGADVSLQGVSTDSRSIAAEELFVALRGERFDGHAFVNAVQARGAAAAMVDTHFTLTQTTLPLMVVADTRVALGRLAAWWRSTLNARVIAVAGSNGKTTTKEMLASILRCAVGETAMLATRGNLNNDIGVPLTVLQMRAAHQLCAIEIGMNHPGEIAGLAAIVQPDVALVTNAQREHLEFMQSIDAVAIENAGVYEALSAQGVAVINADDERAAVFRAAAGARRVVDFSLTRSATVTAHIHRTALVSTFTLRCPAGDIDVQLAIPGRHNILNALAAAAAAYAAGVSLPAIGAGLNAFQAYAGRLQVKSARGGATVIDDTYNANPDSVRAAIDVLMTNPNHTVLVLGDMGEVGEQGADFHAEVGRYARDCGVQTLLALGESTAHSVAAFGEGARHFGTLEDLLAYVQHELNAHTTLLVKGSRFMQMERVVQALCVPAALEVH